MKDSESFELLLKTFTSLRGEAFCWSVVVCADLDPGGETGRKGGFTCGVIINFKSLEIDVLPGVDFNRNLCLGVWISYKSRQLQTVLNKKGNFAVKRRWFGEEEEDETKTHTFVSLFPAWRSLVTAQ